MELQVSRLHVNLNFPTREYDIQLYHWILFPKSNIRYFLTIIWQLSVVKLYNMDVKLGSKMHDLWLKAQISNRMIQIEFNRYCFGALL